MRVVIIGGGVIGLMAAHYLRKGGAEVVVLERGRVGAACSAGNAGWVTPSISIPLPAPGLRLQSLRWMMRADAPLYIKPSAAPRMLGFLLRFWQRCNERDFRAGCAAFATLAADTMERYDELAADGIAFESHSDGLLMAFRHAEEMAAERALLEGLGYGPLRFLSAAELQDLEPALAPGAAGGIHILAERTVRPETVCGGTADHLRRHGVAVKEESAVSGLEIEGHTARAVRLAGEEIEGDAFLIATGAEAARLAAQCGSRLPLQAGKGYSVTIRDPAVAIRHPLYLGSIRVGMSPFDGALRIAGTMELSGVNLELDPRRVAALKRGAEREVPGVTVGASAVEWVGMRPITPDGLPILGALPSCRNVYVATGHQMLGVTLAPSTGKLMADLILDGRSAIDLRPFSPGRFGRA
jgi:D-amino-acid dehydrogenase